MSSSYRCLAYCLAGFLSCYLLTGIEVGEQGLQLLLKP